jgi:hypothetical protein
LSDAIRLLAGWRLKAKAHDLGEGFTIRRALPQASRRSVGPFVFLDHFGPQTFAAGQGLSVRPHPHVGLATMTYLFSGSILHRDSVGSVQEIRPGEINWMVAGRGIVHSERPVPSSPAQTLHGVQFWIALPEDQEDCEPSFQHLKREAFPELQTAGSGATVRLISGEWGSASATQLRVFSRLIFAHISRASESPEQPWSRVSIPPASAPADERAIYLAMGTCRLSVSGEPLQVGDLSAIPTEGCILELGPQTEVVLLGGTSLGPRFMDWNFVSSSREKIEIAKTRWSQQLMGQVPGETEWIPIPGSKTE